MKTRESGMPEESTWQDFFEPREILKALGLTRDTRRVVDFGSGYGTFSLPAAAIIEGEVIGLDIESDLIQLCRRKAREAGLGNTRFVCRDFVTEGSGLEDGSADFVMLFNILHAEEPHILLNEAHRILQPGGILAVIHWNYDERTPRGPAMAIRPRPEDCRKWVADGGFVDLSPTIPIPPWHYGFTATVKQNDPQPEKSP
jgi:SAM-dependent methyltransferase